MKFQVRNPLLPQRALRKFWQDLKARTPESGTLSVRPLRLTIGVIICLWYIEKYLSESSGAQNPPQLEVVDAHPELPAPPCGHLPLCLAVYSSRPLLVLLLLQLGHVEDQGLCWVGAGQVLDRKDGALLHGVGLKMCKYLASLLLIQVQVVNEALQDNSAGHLKVVLLNIMVIYHNNEAIC